jgi:hypothetical protein
MKFSATKHFRANMGNYGENYGASRTVTIDHQDLGYTDEYWRDFVEREGFEAGLDLLREAVLDALEEEIQDEVDIANELRPEGEDSFLGPKKRKRRTRGKTT